MLPFTYVFRHALAWLVQKEGVTIYICVSACTGMVDSEGGCYHLHMCFGICVSACTDMVQKEGVTIYICVSVCTGMVGSEGGCYHLHMSFGLHWHG